MYKPYMKWTFSFTMKEIQKDIWITFRSVVNMILIITQEPNYVDNVEHLLENMKALRCSVNKIFIIWCRRMPFPENFCLVNDLEEHICHTLHISGSRECRLLLNATPWEWRYIIHEEKQPTTATVHKTLSSKELLLNL